MMLAFAEAMIKQTAFPMLCWSHKRLHYITTAATPDNNIVRFDANTLLSIARAFASGPMPDANHLCVMCYTTMARNPVARATKSNFDPVFLRTNRGVASASHSMHNGAAGLGTFASTDNRASFKRGGAAKLSAITCMSLRTVHPGPARCAWLRGHPP